VNLRRRTHLGDNRYEFDVALDEREGPPETGMILPSLGDMGVVSISLVRPAPAAGTDGADRAWILEVETHSAARALADPRPSQR
jgi:hypothetical protein